MADMDDALRGNENRARIEKAGVQNRMSPSVAAGPPIGATSPGAMPPSIRPDEPLMVGPHDGGRRRNDNASPPTRAALHIQNASPGYKGISPAVARELYKAPPAFAAQIRDHARNK
jgi:hypothetical protein